MQIIALAATLFAASSTALALPVEERQVFPYIPCTGLYSADLCCATDVLGVADLDCGDPPAIYTNASEFSSVCAAIGQRARCCVLPLLEQGILCQTPQGVDD